MKIIASFQTVEHFWRVYDHLIRPNEFKFTTDYHLFREVKPIRSLSLLIATKHLQMIISEPTSYSIMFRESSVLQCIEICRQTSYSRGVTDPSLS